MIDAKEEWPDYSYEQLLDLVFDIMRERNPDMVAGEKKKFVMKPPQVARAGSKKTAFTNFSEICRLLKRQPKHVLLFLLAELGTTCVELCQLVTIAMSTRFLVALLMATNA